MKLTTIATAALAAFMLLISSAHAEKLTIGSSSPADSLDPHFSNVDPNIWAAKHFFDMLVDFDEQMNLVPALAESWGPVDDKTWEFKLRHGVKWHDGSPFTADDVIFTYDRVPKVTGSPSSLAGMVLGKKFKKIDDYTVQVSTEEPSTIVPNELTRIAIISKKNGTGLTTSDYQTGKGIIGTGPYKFVSWQAGERITMEANPDYWGGKPEWDQVVIQGIKSDPSRVSALLAGDVDVIDMVPPIDVPRLKKDPNITVDSIASGRVLYLNIDSNRDVSPMVKNNDDSPMFPNAIRDWRVRKAMSMAIDRQGLVDRVMDGLAVPAGQLTPKGAFGYNPTLKPDPYDPEEAKKLLTAAGYPDGFHLTIHGPNDRYVNDSKIMEAVAGMLTRIGIKTDVVTLPKAVYFSRASALEFSITLIGFQSETGEAGQQYRAILGTHNKQTGMGVYNRGRYSNVRLDKMLTEATATLDAAKREKMFLDISALVARDVATIPLYYEVNSWAGRKGLKYRARSDGQTLAQNITKE